MQPQPGNFRPPDADRRLPAILVVDDVEANRRLLDSYLLQIDCRVIQAGDGQAALAAAAADPPDLVLLDAQMPMLDGFEVCRRLKAEPATRLTPVVMVTSLSALGDRVRALHAGADDFLSKPIDRVELVARVQSLLRLKATYDRLEDAEQVILSLGLTVEAKDPYTEAHATRVATSARALAELAGIKGPRLDDVSLGAAIHDIGKVGIPDSILLKAGALTPAEAQVMRRHPGIGAEIVRPLRAAPGLIEIIRHHHEQVDGSGYPDGLWGPEIPLAARIVAVCDAFDALTSDRSYRRGRTAEEALRTLRAGAGKQWDSHLVETFAREVAGKAGQLRAG
jgi:putative two-component system response regulator